MGTIVIEEIEGAGSLSGTDDSVPRNIIRTTADATTSTSAESVATSAGSIVTVHAVSGAHRVSFGSDATGSKYHYIPDGQTRDLALTAPGQTVYYRVDS